MPVSDTLNQAMRMEGEPDFTWHCEPLTFDTVLPHRLHLFNLGVNVAPDGSQNRWMASERFGYRMYHGDTLVFEGVDFFTSLGWSNDMHRVALELLSFLTLQPGDTDPEYFDAYTDAQIDWRDAYAEDLDAEVSAQMDGMTS